MAKDTFRRSYCVSFFFSLQKPFLSQRQRKKNLWFWKKTNSAHSSMHVYKHIYIYIYICALLSFSFWLSMCKYCTVHLKDTFKKKNCFFYEGKKIECSLTHTYVYKYMYVYLYIYTHIWIYIMLTCFLLAIMQPWGHDRLSLWLAP